MEKDDKKAIQSNYSSLVERTDLDLMVNTLYEKGVFSEEMIEPYRDSNVPQRDRKRKLYRDIMKRGPRAFGHLIDALSELGYWDVLRDLDPSHPTSALYRPPISSNPIPINRDPKPSSTENFVSISNEKHKTKTEQQKMTPPPPPPPPADLNNAAAEMPAIPEFNVIKSTSFEEDTDNSDLKLYNTRGRNRGVLVVFTYIEFKDNIEDPRNGADVDCEMLKKLFLEIGFRVLSYKNLNYEETILTLSSMASVLKDAESVFIVVSSHGYERRRTSDIDIRCSDGQLISFYDILAYFSNISLPRLIGIPKVFIFQVCRGRSAEYTWHENESSESPHMPMPEGEVTTDGQAKSSGNVFSPQSSRPANHEPTKTPLYSDILIAQSTLPGSVSFRDPKLGSWYIQALCEVFAARAHNTHVDKLFTLVDKRMRQKHAVQTSAVERWGFNKKLYLHPGLYQ